MANQGRMVFSNHWKAAGRGLRIAKSPSVYPWKIILTGNMAPFSKVVGHYSLKPSGRRWDPGYSTIFYRIMHGLFPGILPRPRPLKPLRRDSAHVIWLLYSINGFIPRDLLESPDEGYFGARISKIAPFCSFPTHTSSLGV